MRNWFRRITRSTLNLVDPYSSTDIPPTGNVLAYLKSHLAPLRRILLLSVFITIFAAGIEVWLIAYSGRLIDTLSNTEPALLWQLHGAELIIVALVLLLLRPASQFARVAINEIGFHCNVATLVRWRAHHHLAHQSVGWFQEDLTGRTSTRLVDIGNYGGDIIYQSLNAVAFGLVYMLGIVILMADTDIRLAIPLFIWLALYVVLLVMVIPRMVVAQQAFQSAKSALVGNVVDSFSNIDTWKLFSHHDALIQDHKTELENTRQALFETRKIGLSLRTILNLLEGAIMTGFVGYGIWLWSQGAATIGLVSAAVALCLRITTMAEWILDSVWMIFLRVGSLREALKTIAQPHAIPVTENAPDLVLSEGRIEIDNVTHHYGKKQGGLDGVTLTVAPGEKVGLVGRSGAGKSTLVNLILRFYEIENGTISIDGQDIRGVEPDSLRAAISMVSQQASLLNRSVRDNISLGREDINLQQIEHAAREARAHEFIVKLKDNKGRCGYDAHVGERGIKLSGGQRQRIALARVVLKNAPILILDEATSALDSEVEAEIQSALTGVMQNKSVIAIAHRLSTISQMDRIVVLDAGKVVEQGNHQQLMESNGLYAKFWTLQSGGFIGQI